MSLFLELKWDIMMFLLFEIRVREMFRRLLVRLWVLVGRVFSR